MLSAQATDVGVNKATKRLFELAPTPAAMVALGFMIAEALLGAGLVIFGEWPDLWTWTGSALVVGAGVYTIWREAQLGRR